jgi:glycine C-acetyltransferase
LEQQLGAELDALREARTYKQFLILQSPQGPVVRMEGRGEVVVLSSNNYLGLAGHPEVVRAGIEGLERYGAGTASVRFICGTFEPHHALERALADLSGTEAALTYVSCWNANEAAIPSLTDESTVILTDELNHASLIDAIRLSRPAGKVIYPHSDMSALREGLAAAPRDARKLVVTDGVFSMEGDLAKLPEIVELAREFDAIVIVDDSHGVGVLGETGRGTVEHFGLLGEVDVITGTLGKALGGAAGGYVAASEEVCDILAQRSRPQLFSNALPPTVACSALRSVELMLEDPSLLARLRENTQTFRTMLVDVGYSPLEGEAAIIPIIIGETAEAMALSAGLLEDGVFVTGFGFPVVPEGTARIRVQMSAALEHEHLEQAIQAFDRARP